MVAQQQGQQPQQQQQHGEAGVYGNPYGNSGGGTEGPISSGAATNGGTGLLMGGAPADGYGNGGGGYGAGGAGGANGYGGGVVEQQQLGGDAGVVGVPPAMEAQVASWLSSLMVTDKGILFEGGPIKVRAGPSGILAPFSSQGPSAFGLGLSALSASLVCRVLFKVRSCRSRVSFLLWLLLLLFPPPH